MSRQEGVLHLHLSNHKLLLWLIRQKWSRVYGKGGAIGMFHDKRYCSTTFLEGKKKKGKRETIKYLKMACLYITGNDMVTLFRKHRMVSSVSCVTALSCAQVVRLEMCGHPLSFTSSRKHCGVVVFFICEAQCCLDHATQ